MQDARRFFLALVVAAVAGCGGGGERPMETADEAAPEEVQPRTDLCPLLTSEDMEEVLGEAPGAPETSDEMLGQCSWPKADGSGTLAVVRLEEAVLGSFDEFVTEYGVEFGGENPPRDEYHPVEGVPGDWAMYVAEEQKVQAYHGEHVLEVSAPGADEEQVTALATRAMRRFIDTADTM